MNENLKMIWEHIKTFSKTGKDKLLAIYNWKQGEVWAWALKVLLMVLIVIGMVFLLKILPYLLVIAVIVIAYLWEKAPASTLGTVQMQNHHFVVREIIFSVISNNVTLLDIQKPTTVEDITPTEYPVLQQMNGITFYRFIFYPNPSNIKDFTNMITLTNNKVRQLLQGGFPNVAVPFYNGFPSVFVLKIGEDSYHNGYLHIDILPVLNERSFQYAQHEVQWSHKQAVRANRAVPAPKDEDF